MTDSPDNTSQAEPEPYAQMLAHKVAALVKTLSDTMRAAVADSTRDASGVRWVHQGTNGRTLDALIKRRVVREDRSHAFPRYRLTSTGLSVYKWITGDVDDAAPQAEPTAQRSERNALTLPAPAGAPELIDTWGITTRNLESFLRKNVAEFTRESHIYVRTSDGQQWAIDHAWRDDVGDLMVSVRTLDSIGQDGGAR